MRSPLPVRILPGLAFEAWLTPPPLGAKIRAGDRQSLADFDMVHFGGVPGHEIGDGPRAVALHGWGGRPAQMGAIARRLASIGFRVLIPEMPGRAGGPRTDIKESSATLRAVIDDVGTPELVIAHSFASMVARLAFAESAPRKVVLIAPALDVRDALQVFGDRLRLSRWARRGLRRRLQDWDPALWPTVSQSPPSQLSDAEVMILHDPADTETPFSRSAELAPIRPRTSIVAIEGAGHSRILSESATLDAVTAFARQEALGGESAA